MRPQDHPHLLPCASASVSVRLGVLERQCRKALDPREHWTWLPGAFGDPVLLRGLVVLPRPTVSSCSLPYCDRCRNPLRAATLAYRFLRYTACASVAALSDWLILHLSVAVAKLFRRQAIQSQMTL